MFALVRFLKEFDNKLYVIPASDVNNFHPQDENDFDRRTVYTAFWKEDTQDCPSSYQVQILMLAETRDRMAEKQKTKRVLFPKLNASEAENDYDDSPDCSQRQKSSYRQDNRRQREVKSAAQDNAYDDILRTHIENARSKNQAVISGASTRTCQPPQNPRKKMRKERVESSDSDQDDGLIPESQLKQAREETLQWKKWYEREEKENARLTKRLEYLENTMAKKFEEMHRLLEEVSKSAHKCVCNEPATDSSSSQHTESRNRNAKPGCTGLSPAAVWETESTALFSQVTENDSNATRIDASNQRDQTGQASSSPLQTGVATFTAEASSMPLFTRLGNGQYHVKNGVTLSEDKFFKILRNPRPTLVAKDFAQALWGAEVLRQRSYGGMTTPQQRKDPSAVPRKELTPEKVALVIDMVSFWGRERNQDVSSAISNISNILAQKIQDLRRQPRRR